MTHSNQKGPIRRLVDAVKAGVKAFRDSAPLKEDKDDYLRYGGYGQQLKLIDAIESGDYAKAKEAIDKGADVNKWGIVYTGEVSNRKPWEKQRLPMITPLALALKLGREDIALLLKERGAAPLQEPTGAAAKHDTIWQSSLPEEVKAPEKELIAARLDEAYLPFLKPEDASLFLAITAGDTQAVRAALQSGADLKAVHRYIPEHRSKDCIMMEPVTPLAYALKTGNDEIIALLRESGAKQ